MYMVEHSYMYMIVFARPFKWYLDLTFELVQGQIKNLNVVISSE